LALFQRRGNKQAEEKQIVSVIYLHPGKHLIVIKQQTTFLESKLGRFRRYAVTEALFAVNRGELTLPEI